MNKFMKNLIILFILAAIGIGTALIINNNLEKNNHKIMNIALENQMIEKKLLTNETGIFGSINETTAELIFDNESLGIIKFGEIFSLEDLKLPMEKEKQAIDIVLSDPEVKKILYGKKYNITKIQKVAITTANQTSLSDDNVVVEIETNEFLYLVNVDMIKREVQGDMAKIPR